MKPRINLSADAEVSHLSSARLVLKDTSVYFSSRGVRLGLSGGIGTHRFSRSAE